MASSSSMIHRKHLQDVYYKDNLLNDGSNEGIIIVFVKKFSEDLAIVFRGFDTADDEDDDEEMILEVSYLPPVQITFTVPSGFPSELPPTFKIICPWLSKEMLMKLYKKLQEIWEEGKNFNILRRWRTFIKNDLMTFLDIKDALYIAPDKKIQENNDGVENKSEDLDMGAESQHLNAEIETSTLKTETGYQDLKKNIGDEDIDFEMDVDPNTVETQNVDLGAGDMDIDFESKDEARGQEDFNSNAANQDDCHTGICDLGTVVGSEGGDTFENKMYDSAVEPSDYIDQFQNDCGKILLFFLQYNTYHKDYKYLESSIKCEICFEPMFDECGTKMTPCEHYFCDVCMDRYFNEEVDNGRVLGLGCPSYKCDTEIHPLLVKAISSAELYERYETMLVHKAIAAMPDTVYCPRRMCGYPASIEEGTDLVQCAQCKHSFCHKCMRPYHGVNPCKLETDKHKRILEQYLQGDNRAKRNLAEIHGRENLQNILNSAKSEVWIDENTKQCPHCRKHVQKTDGCNKIVCACKGWFCWICGGAIDKNEVVAYSHFLNEASPCYNKLFADAEEEEEEEVFVEFVYD